MVDNFFTLQSSPSAFPSLSLCLFLSCPSFSFPPLPPLSLSLFLLAPSVPLAPSVSLLSFSLSFSLFTSPFRVYLSLALCLFLWVSLPLFYCPLACVFCLFLSLCLPICFPCLSPSHPSISLFKSLLCLIYVLPPIDSHPLLPILSSPLYLPPFTSSLASLTM